MPTNETVQQPWPKCGGTMDQSLRTSRAQPPNPAPTMGLTPMIRTSTPTLLAERGLFFSCGTITKLRCKGPSCNRWGSTGQMGARN